MDCGVKSFVHWCQADRNRLFSQVHVLIGEEHQGAFCPYGMGIARRGTVFVIILSSSSKEVCSISPQYFIFGYLLAESRLYQRRVVVEGCWWLKDSWFHENRLE